MSEHVYEHRAHAQHGDATYLTFKTVISLDLNLRAPGVLGDLQAAMRRGEVTREFSSRRMLVWCLILGSMPLPFRIIPFNTSCSAIN